MTNRLDLYAILGVPPSATQAEISHAYRVLLRRHHPDTRAIAGEPSAVSDTTLQQILAAYMVLRDPARRADYDRQAGRRVHPTRRRSQQAVSHYRVDGQPPIVAGPVRRHRAP